MFEQTFVIDQERSRKSLRVLLSLSFQILAVAILMLVQLVYIQPLPTAQLRSLLLGPPAPIVRSQPPSSTRPTASSVPQRLSRFALIAPRVIPPQVNPGADTEAAPTIETGLPATSLSGGNNDLLTSLINIAPSSPPPAPRTHPVTRDPVRIGGTVAAANLIHQVQPIYPAVARSARIEGTVEFTATIDRRGSVVNLSLVRGHPLLVAAARDAILQWRYRPTTLNGQPVEVLTTITVHFKLSN